MQACLGKLKQERESSNEGQPILHRGHSWFEHRTSRCPPPFAGLDASQPYRLHHLRDITATWRLAEERRFLERLYRTLSVCNRTLVHALDAKSLAQGICDTLIQMSAQHFLDISIWVNHGSDTYERLAFSVQDEIAGNAALVERLHDMSHDIVAHKLPELLARSPENRRQPASIPAEAFRDDFASPPEIRCYPLIGDSKPLGGLVITSAPGEISRIQEFGLLEELAGDLAFGLETLALREKAARLEAEREALLERERDNLTATAHAIANTVEVRDPYTAGHQRRVADISLRLAEILIEAQILAAADVIEAMATHRPYRPALPLLDALQYVVQNRDGHFPRAHRRRLPETVHRAALQLEQPGRASWRRCGE